MFIAVVINQELEWGCPLMQGCGLNPCSSCPHDVVSLEQDITGEREREREIEKNLF